MTEHDMRRYVGCDRAYASVICETSELLSEHGTRTGLVSCLAINLHETFQVNRDLVQEAPVITTLGYLYY